MTAPVVATVGTTHPLAFAGLVFAALSLADDGVRPVCVIAGVTAQDGRAVLARSAIDAGTIGAQFAALREAGVAAFHVGALLDTNAVRAVAAGLASYPGVPVVVDPVLAASTGEALAANDVLDALREVLLPLATLVTPNLAEASALANVAVDDVEAMESAATACRTFGAHAVLVKGGHLDGDPVDVLVDTRGTRSWTGERAAGTMRGTGDLLAVTIAAGLARGASLDEAIVRARERVRLALAASESFAGTHVARMDDRRRS